MDIKLSNFNQEGTDAMCVVEYHVQWNDAWTLDIAYYIYILSASSFRCFRISDVVPGRT
jgi:hypothetical protein